MTKGDQQATGSHKRAWKQAHREDITRCFWCDGRFVNPDNPPTFDHVQPKSLGGTLLHGTVLSCQSCNSARGNIPFDEYLEAVEAERVLAKLEKRSFRRPKQRLVCGQWVVTTLTKRMIQEIEANAAIGEIGWIEPHDVAQDKRWDREEV